MGQPAAKQNDTITATDTHIVMTPTPGGPVPTPTPLPFAGVINAILSSNVKIMGLPAAMMGSTATNTPPHPPLPYQVPPTNLATIIGGSGSVRINKQPAARNGDPAQTCTDIPNGGGKVIAAGSVLIGD